MEKKYNILNLMAKENSMRNTDFLVKVARGDFLGAPLNKRAAWDIYDTALTAAGGLAGAGLGYASTSRPEYDNGDKLQAILIGAGLGASSGALISQMPANRTLAALTGALIGGVISRRLSGYFDNPSPY